MIEILKDFPDDVLAISATGRLTAADYRDVLIPEANRHFKTGRPLRMLAHFGPTFTGMTAGAAWADTRFGIGHWKEFGRIAIVSDSTWIKDSVLLFAPFFHHAIRIFSNDELATAKEWILEKEETS
ncbi:MAG: STAS/SEC14 domain-containing protein [Hyphomicrobiaceae bacterium]|nr:STAS/SEC14 domain-containing protein [Hyphomicrobiaceae bacterium]